MAAAAAIRVARSALALFETGSHGHGQPATATASQPASHGHGHIAVPSFVLATQHAPHPPCWTTSTQPPVCVRPACLAPPATTGGCIPVGEPADRPRRRALHTPARQPRSRIQQQR